jgi:hypothetical protein
MREVKVRVPEYLSIGQYQEIDTFGNLEPLNKMLKVITTLSEYTEKEVRTWPIETIVEVAGLLADVTTADNEFHTIVEFKGKMYGFANLSRNKFGEYLDLEDLLKDPIGNLHHIAAVFYRPITKHRFGSFSFIFRHGHNVANNKVKDPFKWYTIEKYDSEVREERSEMMKDFPVQLILGAMGFTSATGTLSLNDTLYSQNQITEKEKEETQRSVLKSLSHSITGGGGLYTTFRKPIYSRLQEMKH